MSHVYMIGYDLKKPGQHYEKLENAIQSFETWWHHLDSTWLIVCDHTAAEVRDYLVGRIDSNDMLLVAELKGPAAWTGFDEKGANWIKKQLEQQLAA